MRALTAKMARMCTRGLQASGGSQMPQVENTSTHSHLQLPTQCSCRPQHARALAVGHQLHMQQHQHQQMGERQANLQRVRSIASATSPAVTSVTQAEVHATDAHADRGRPRLFIVDVMAQVYRITHGFGAKNGKDRAVKLNNDEGTDTAVLHSFMVIMVKLLSAQPPPTHFALVVDAPTKTFRHELFPEYKAQRPPTPEGLRENVGRILQMVAAMGIPILCVPGVEADDVIGTLARRMAHEGADVVIVSSDKDFFQLLSPYISLMRMLSNRLGGLELYTEQQFTEQHEIPDPKLWADVLALMGDSSDNIPGVKGVGDKTAKDLVRRFGDVERILEHAAEVKRKAQRELLLSDEGRNTARLSKDLVTIVTDLQVPQVRDPPLEAFKLGLPPNGGEELTKLLHLYQLQWVSDNLAKVYSRWRAHGLV